MRLVSLVVPLIRYTRADTHYLLAVVLATASNISVDWPGSRVYIDVDPRACDSSEQSDSKLSHLAKSGSYSLGLDATMECVWVPSISSAASYVFSHESACLPPRYELLWLLCRKYRMCWILVQIYHWRGHSL
jgi:hypothetical protein